MRSEADGLALILHEGVAELVIDQPGRKVNALGRGLLEALENALRSLETRDDDDGVRGLIVRSGKANQFVAGADLREILRLSREEPSEIERFVDLGHRVFNRLAEVPFPTLALIAGPCLGGGLELALACDARIAADDESTGFGLPEVLIGLIPSWGGTQRLPRLLEAGAAAEMVLSGRRISAGEASALGLADAKCGVGDLLGLGRSCLKSLIGDVALWRPRREARADVVVGMPVEPPVEGPGAEGSRAAFCAAWQALSQGAPLPLAAGLEREREVAVPLFLAEEARARIEGMFARRR